MDVKIFFNPVTERLFHGIDSNYSFYKNIFLPGPAFPDIKKADIALIGLEEFGARAFDGQVCIPVAVVHAVD